MLFDNHPWKSLHVDVERLHGTSENISSKEGNCIVSLSIGIRSLGRRLACAATFFFPSLLSSPFRKAELAAGRTTSCLSLCQCTASATFHGAAICSATLDHMSGSNLRWQVNEWEKWLGWPGPRTSGKIDQNRLFCYQPTCTA